MSEIAPPKRTGAARIAPLSNSSRKRESAVRRWFHLILPAALALVLLSTWHAWGQRPTHGIRRADRAGRVVPPPAWPAELVELFFADAREQLGPGGPPQPREGAGPPIVAGGAINPPAAAPPAASGAEPAAGRDGAADDEGASGLAWSSFVSRDVLEDEVKAIAPAIAADVANPTRFKSGGFQTARVGFSTLAAVFGVIAEYDGDVRWRAEAAGLRTLFAQAARNAKVSSDSAYKESKLRSELLSELVRGSSTGDLPAADGSAPWPGVVDRRPLMQRMEVALRDRLGPWTGNASEWSRNQGPIAHEAQMLLVLAEIIRHEEYDYADDEQYRGYVDLLREQARALSEAARQSDQEAAARAISGIRQACDQCHGDYRG